VPTFIPALLVEVKLPNERLLAHMRSGKKADDFAVGWISMPHQRSKLCVDIDNVLGQTDEVMRGIIRVATNGKALPGGVDYCYEDIKEFEYNLCKDRSGNSVSKEVWEAVHRIFQDPNSGYVDLIQPTAGALQALIALRERWDIWMVTARHDDGLRKAIAWVERHFPGFSSNVHSSYGRKKWEVASFTAAVDDHLETSLGFADNGVRSFVYDHPWNRKAANDRRLTVVKSWSQLIIAIKRFYN
jgi:hypothetical protein